MSSRAGSILVELAELAWSSTAATGPAKDPELVEALGILKHGRATWKTTPADCFPERDEQADADQALVEIESTLEALSGGKAGQSTRVDSAPGARARRAKTAELVLQTCIELVDIQGDCWFCGEAGEYGRTGKHDEECLLHDVPEPASFEPEIWDEHRLLGMLEARIVALRGALGRTLSPKPPTYGDAFAALEKDDQADLEYANARAALTSETVPDFLMGAKTEEAFVLLAERSANMHKALETLLNLATTDAGTKILVREFLLQDERLFLSKLAPLLEEACRASSKLKLV